jgi:predicted Zn finger-like uncharacterized protein
VANIHGMNPLNHSLAIGIQKVGFRKWYERELLSSHAHMVLAFLCIIGMMAAFEAFKGGTLADKLFDTVAILVCVGVGLWALRRYLALLMNAENIANQANCPHCAAYGLFNFISEDSRPEQTRVRCRKCVHEWTIES